MAVELDLTYASELLDERDFAGIERETAGAARLLDGRRGAGSGFLGWLDLPRTMREALPAIREAAERLSASQAVLVVGIGGSYLGARAALEYLKSPFYNALKKTAPDLYFIGNNLSASYHEEILSLCVGKELSAIVISKSGTTTEPAAAFRAVRSLFRERYGAKASERIVAVTDERRGALRELCDAEGYRRFAVPDDVGGRYSVLSAVGLLPLAAAGVDIEALLDGAGDAFSRYASLPFSENPCHRYAAARNLLYRKGRVVEVFASYEPCFVQTAEWLKQLFGESEGKDRKGIFPASASFTADLHSLGQFLQDGSRNLFETVVDIRGGKSRFSVAGDASDGDGLGYLAGKPYEEINRSALEAVAAAHAEGGTPTLLLSTGGRTEYEYGMLLAFFERACAVSGYLLGVNPFNQPGVEGYKRNLFALLGKPGYEDERERLLKRK